MPPDPGASAASASPASCVSAPKFPDPDPERTSRRTVAGACASTASLSLAGIIRGELGDESAQAGVFASGGTRALFLRVWQRRVVFLILRVGNLGVFRRRRGELVLLLAAASGVGRLGHLGPAAEALFQPPVRHDALQAVWFALAHFAPSNS